MYTNSGDIKVCLQESKYVQPVRCRMYLDAHSFVLHACARLQNGRGWSIEYSSSRRPFASGQQTLPVFFVFAAAARKVWTTTARVRRSLHDTVHHQPPNAPLKRGRRGANRRTRGRHGGVRVGRRKRYLQEPGQIEVTWGAGRNGFIPA